MAEKELRGCGRVKRLGKLLYLLFALTLWIPLWRGWRELWEVGDELWSARRRARMLGGATLLIPPLPLLAFATLLAFGFDAAAPALDRVEVVAERGADVATRTWKTLFAGNVYILVLILSLLVVSSLMLVDLVRHGSVLAPAGQHPALSGQSTPTPVPTPAPSPRPDLDGGRAEPPETGPPARDEFRRPRRPERAAPSRGDSGGQPGAGSNMPAGPGGVSTPLPPADPSATPEAGNAPAATPAAQVPRATGTAGPAARATPTLPVPTHRPETTQPPSTTTATAAATATATPSATATAAATATATPSAAATATPSATATATASPAAAPLPICRNVKIGVDAGREGDRVVMRVAVSNDPTLVLTRFSIRIFKNGDESAPEMAVERPDGSRAEAAVYDEGPSYLLTVKRRIEASNPGVTVLASYRASQAVLTSDDSFRAQLLDSGVDCTTSGSIEELGARDGATPQPIEAEITMPSGSDQVFTRRDKLRLEAQAHGPTRVERIEFMIVDAQGNLLWRWSEYSGRYCAFGGDSLCVPPPETWWEALPEGRYTLKVTAYALDGGRADDERSFVKGTPALTAVTPVLSPTAVPSPSATPATELPTATPSSSAEPPPPTATPTATP